MGQWSPGNGTEEPWLHGMREWDSGAGGKEVGMRRYASVAYYLFFVEQLHEFGHVFSLSYVCLYAHRF